VTGLLAAHPLRALAEDVDDLGSPAGAVADGDAKPRPASDLSKTDPQWVDDVR
jgi:hypothetical protein